MWPNKCDSTIWFDASRGDDMYCSSRYVCIMHEEIMVDPSLNGSIQ